MIQQITSERLHEIGHLFDEYDAAQPTNPFARDAPPLKERLQRGVEAGRININAYSIDDSFVGFIATNSQWGSIMIVHTTHDHDGSFPIKRELFDNALESLSEFDPVRIGGNAICDNLSDYAISKGFERLDRKYMSLPRAKLLNLSEVELPEGYVWEEYQSKDRNEIAKLVHEANVGNVDMKVFPNFFSSIEASISLIDNIERNVYGTYKEGYSLIIRKGNEPVGVIFLTLLSPDTGYIPDICIHKEHRKRGLGKAMMTKSMKAMAEREPAMNTMDLDVTLANPARFLYESLGVETVREYSIHMLFKDA